MRGSNVGGFESLGTKVGERAGRMLAALLMFGFLLAIGVRAARAQCPTTGTNPIDWKGGNGNWGDNNWSTPGCVPNNAPPAFFDVSINGFGSDTITFNVNPTTIDSLTLGGGEILAPDNQLYPGRSLTIGSSNVAGVLNNSGTINWGLEGALTLNISLGNGGVTNSGTINLTGSSLTIDDGGNRNTANLAGLLGTINLAGAEIRGANGTETLNNVGFNSIAGNGDIYSLTLINGNGTIWAKGGILTITPGFTNTFTNNEGLRVDSGSRLLIVGPGAFTNFSGNTLTGGGYFVDGTLQFDGANIVTSAANITLEGPGSQIVDENGNNALAHFANNANGSTFFLANGRNFDNSGTVATFTNNGSLSLLGSAQTMTVNNLTDGPGSNLGVNPGSNLNVKGTFNDVAGGTLNTEATYGLSGSLTYSGSDINTIGANTGVAVGGGGGFVNTNGAAHDPLQTLATINGSLTLFHGHDLDTSATVPTFTNNGVLNLGGSPGQTLTVNDFDNNSQFLRVERGSTIAVKGMFDNAGTVNVDGGAITVGADFNNQNGATTNVQNGSTLAVGGNFSGEANIQNASTARISGSLGGILTLDGSTLAVGADFRGGGNIQNGSTATISGLLNTLDTLIVDGSNLTVGEIFAEGTTTSIQNGSTVTVAGSLINLGRPFFPYFTFTDLGIDHSTLTVGGDFDNSGSAFTHVQNGSTVAITGTLENDAALGVTLNIDHSTLTAGSFHNFGPGANVFGPGAIVGNGSTVTIAGTLENDGALNIDHSALTAGNFDNNFGAVATIENGSTVAIAGTVFNSSTLNAANATLSVGGTLTNIGGSAFNLTGGSSATVGLAGTNTQVLTNDRSTITVDASTLTVNGEFLNEGLGGVGATANIQNGATLTAFSILNVNPSTTFNVTGGSNATVQTGLDNSGGATLTVDAATLTLDSLSTDTFATTNIQNGATVSTNNLFNETGGTLNVTGAQLNVTSNLVNNSQGTFNLTGGGGTTVGSVTNPGMLTNSGATITVGDSSGLTVNGDFNNQNKATTNVGQSGGVLNVNNFFNTTGSSLDLSGGGLVEAATFTNAAGSSVTFNDVARLSVNVFNNSGTVTLGGDFYPSHEILDAGSFNNTGGSVVINSVDFPFLIPERIRASNYVQSGSAATLEVDGVLDAPTVMIEGGTVSGSGVIYGDVQNTGGNVNPVDPVVPSVLQIQGDYTQGLGGTLTIDILGTSLGEYSVLDVSGTATLDGTLEIDFINGFTAGSFSFLDFGSLVGDFSNIDFVGGLCQDCSYTEVIGPGGITLDTKTPEPASLLLLGTALLGIAAIVRRLNAHHA